MATNRRVSKVSAIVEQQYGAHRVRLTNLNAIIEQKYAARIRISKAVLMVEYKIDLPPKRRFGPGGEWM
jgi:hypothetical protein